MAFFLQKNKKTKARPNPQMSIAHHLTEFKRALHFQVSFGYFRPNAASVT